MIVSTLQSEVASLLDVQRLSVQVCSALFLLYCASGIRTLNMCLHFTLSLFLLTFDCPLLRILMGIQAHLVSFATSRAAQHAASLEAWEGLREALGDSAMVCA